MRSGLLVFFLSAIAYAQALPELTSAEKQFAESLNDVTLIGFFTLGDAPELHEDRYVIERASKVKDDIWKFEARIQYNKKDFKVALPLPVKWAGDTPVISLTKYVVPVSDLLRRG